MRISMVQSLEFSTLAVHAREHSYEIAGTALSEEAWALQPANHSTLFAKLMAAGQPLGEYVGQRIYFGLKTGLNEAFEIGTDQRSSLAPGAANDGSADQAIPWRAEYSTLLRGGQGPLLDRDPVRLDSCSARQRTRPSSRPVREGCVGLVLATASRARRSPPSIRGPVTATPGSGRVLVGAAAVRLLRRPRPAEDHLPRHRQGTSLPPRRCWDIRLQHRVRPRHGRQVPPRHPQLEAGLVCHQQHQYPVWKSRRELPLSAVHSVHGEAADPPG